MQKDTIGEVELILNGPLTEGEEFKTQTELLTQIRPDSFIGILNNLRFM